jgi:hypothetical protein
MIWGQAAALEVFAALGPQKPPALDMFTFAQKILG